MAPPPPKLLPSMMTSPQKSSSLQPSSVARDKNQTKNKRLENFCTTKPPQPHQTPQLPQLPSQPSQSSQPTQQPQQLQTSLQPSLQHQHQHQNYLYPIDLNSKSNTKLVKSPGNPYLFTFKNDNINNCNNDNVNNKENMATIYSKKKFNELREIFENNNRVIRNEMLKLARDNNSTNNNYTTSKMNAKVSDTSHMPNRHYYDIYETDLNRVPKVCANANNTKCTSNSGCGNYNHLNHYLTKSNDQFKF